MKNHALSQLSESRLLQATAALVRQGHAHQAVTVQHLAEVLRRRAYRPTGYSSMYQYYLLELHLSEASASKLIWAARLSRRFPGVLEAIAEGRVHLSGIRELARHMTRANAAELLEAATHRTREEIRVMLARRFLAPDVHTSLLPVTAPDACASPDTTSGKCPKQSPGPVVPSDCDEIAASMEPLASHAPGYPRVTPLATGRFALQVTLSQDAHDLLRRAQELLAHAQPESEIAQVLERALRELVRRLEQRKFGDTDAPRARRASCDTRAIPAEVRRQVAERDGKRCTFVSERGVRCEARSSLEFDHVLPFAQGGRSTVANLRLRCRAHNQLAAEHAFGREFIESKREQSERRAAEARRARSGTDALAPRCLHVPARSSTVSP